MEIIMSTRETGSYQTLGSLQYFVPYALPPKAPLSKGAIRLYLKS